tara:strand:+ start:1444 stop:1578 length:135 start_codon:yes stop_codon:yes gene_type:complete
MNTIQKNKKSLFQKFIDLVAKIFSIKRRKKREEKSKTDDIYPLW